MSGIMGDLMEAPMESNDPRKSKVNVAIRVRPFIKREIGETEKWSVTDTELVLKNDLARTFEARYIYDHVFGKETKTEQIYQEVVAPIVNKSFKGFNGTILCYGQTSSGKTHTLYGSDTDKGIISLFAEHLFEQIKTDQGFKEYIVRVGCIEIYNEKLTDLLNSENQIDIVERNGEVYPSNLEENTATNADELIEIAEAAQRNRRTAETLMNKFSSRSHTVLRVKIEIANLGAAAIDGDSSNTPACTTSILHFVDLAGSEKQSQTGAEGDRLTEAKNINKSLSSLSLVINQLSSNASIPELNEKALSRTASTDPRKEIRPRFVNFRDSKLTRLLQSTLNGEAFISLICNVTVANEAETKSTLQFAKQAKNIKVQPKQNFSSSNEFEKKINELRQLLWARDEENARLQKRLEGLEGFMKTEFKIYPHEKTPFQSTPGVDNAELRRYSLPFRDPTEKKGKPLLSVFKPPFPKLDNEDGFMSSADTTLHFQQLTKNRDSEIFEKENCDKEVQTDVLNPSTEDDFDCSVPKKRKTSSGTPISTLRLTSTILRNAYETDQSEWAERLAFLEEENKCLKSLEETNDELRKEVATLNETVKELTFQKTELEKDVLRQMEASKRNCSRILQDVTKSDQYKEIEDKYKQSEAHLEAANEDIRNLKNQLQCLQEQFQIAKEDFELLKSQTEDFKSGEHEALVKNNKQSQADLEAANEAIKELKNQLQFHKEQLEKAKEDFELLESQTEDFKSEEHETLLQNHKQSQADLEAANEDIRALKNQLECLKEQLEISKEDSKLQGGNENKVSSAIQCQMGTEDVTESDQYKEIEDKYKQSEAHLEAANEDIRALKNQLQCHKEQLEEAKENFELLKSQTEEFKSGEYETLLQNYKAANENIRELENQLQCHKEQLEKTKEDFELLKSQTEDFKSGEYEAVLQNHKQSQIDLEAANEDIRGLKDQLECHKKQLEKAKENFELLKSQTEEFKSGEYEALLQNYKQSQADLEAANENIREMKSQLQCHKEQLEKAKENFELLESQTEEFKSGEYEALLQNYKQSQADLEAANENIREMKSQLQCHKEQLEKAKEDFELLKSQAEGKSGEYEALLLNYKHSQADLEAANENIRELKNQLQFHKEQLEKAKENFKLLESQAEGKSGEYEAMLQNYKQSQADLEVANENIRELENQLQCHKEELEKTKEKLQGERGNKVNSAIQCQMGIEDVTKSDQYKEIEHKYKQAEAHLEAANKDIRELKNQLQCHKEELEKTKEQLQRKKGFTVNRACQAELGTEDADAWKEKAKDYKLQAILFQKKLQARESEHGILQEKNARIIELESLITRKEDDIQQLQKHMLSLIPERKITQDAEVNCTLLNEQVKRTERGEKGLLPPFIPDIYKLRADLRSAKDNLANAKIQLHKCTCSGNRMETSKAGPFGGTVMNSKPSSTISKTFTSSSAIGFRPPKSLQLSRLTAVRTTNEDHPCAHIPVTTKSAVTEHSGSNLQNAPVMNANNSIEPVAPECYRQPEPLSLQPSRLNSVRTNYGDTASPAINRHPVTESQNIPPTTAQYQEETEESDDQSMNWFYEVVAKADAKKKAKTNTNLSNQ